jgi:Meiotic cell cortex C-terminal pleckstrin homology
MENKTNDIEKLEQSLHQTQQQNDLLNANLLSSNKQTREVKRQMQLLEGGTLSAISDLSKERDDALKDVSELQRRLEHSQKRAKTQEETADRTQALWDRDRESWQNERRGLETKVQIAEGRLKVVLSEIANAQQNGRPMSPERRAESRNSILESPGKGRGRGRRHSATSVNSDHMGGRVSVLSFANGTTINLADELAFDEEEEDHFNGEYSEGGRISPDALPEEHIRPASSLSIKARKVLGLPFDFEGEEAKENFDPSKTESISRQSTGYVDTGVQFEPSTSPWPTLDGQQKRHARPAELHLTGRQSAAGLHSPVSPTESMDSKYAPWNYTGPIMVSSACQTVEALPSPPLTPEKAEGTLATIHESIAEVETTTIGTQTDPVFIKTQRTWQHLSNESRDLQIPLINIIPPTSRPVTPEASTVVLPPRTKNASAQVDLTQAGFYASSAMQTEEIRVDRRNIIPPSQMPVPPQMPPPPPTSSFKAPISSRPVPSIPMRGRKPSPSSAMLASQRMNVGISRIPPTNDNGPLARDFAANLPRPVRSSSLYQGFDDGDDNGEDKFDDDMFPEDDVFTRPTAKFTLRSGKMVSQDRVLEEIGESAAASAGEAAALDNLRASEDSLPPDMRKFFIQGRNTPPVGGQRPPLPTKSLRRVPSAKSTNMRRAALISSGSAAHRASNSASTNASLDSNNPPPFPVPLRYSSARIHKSVSEGGRSSRASSAASPTKPSKFKGKNILRKTRSGPAISPHAQARKSRSRSPPLESRVSIVPEMPTFEMPAEPPAFLSEPYSDPREASAPRPSIATGPRRNTSHLKTNSDVVSMQQTSVVDSIAQTMVGEWMYKYVRRRKSFGMTDKSNDWDANKSVEEISASVTNNGVRHKRWVWLAPYERAVMWSSKQPTSGSALMGGKSGRKREEQRYLPFEGVLTGSSDDQVCLGREGR